MQDTAVTVNGEQRRHGVQAIARASAVLRAVAASPDGIGLSELAVAVGLPKSTVHRLLGALAEERFVAHKPDGGIRLGPGIAELGAATTADIRDALRPLLLVLGEKLDETIDLAILDGTEVRFVDQVPAPHRLRAVSAVGTSFPLHCTANGKALLAAITDAEALALLPSRLERHTPNTIVDRERLLAELAEVRRTGVGFDREEHTEGISAAGIAVSDPGGRLAAISVPVPTSRFTRNEERYAEALRRAASRSPGMWARPRPPAG